MRILGVCEKLSSKSNIDKVLFQFGFIVAAVVSGGTAIIIYLLAHLLLD
jgi:phage shock protein PspC (stress-responsive transcriptional regulator)